MCFMSFRQPSAHPSLKAMAIALCGVVILGNGGKVDVGQSLTFFAMHESRV
jgi:hypothetical protein